jgi:hypothetical protein
MPKTKSKRPIIKEPTSASLFMSLPIFSYIFSVSLKNYPDIGLNAPIGHLTSYIRLKASCIAKAVIFVQRQVILPTAVEG